uniref:Uncharacterized protein n=1 Tax=uncultured prokaryote TaxID=198431 RepID=A0A0H5PZK5_9ZZZZ|nr:hypothetical protein [uncultured prokaryote]
MGLAVVQVRIPHRNNLGKDDAINTFAFTTLNPVEDAAEGIATKLKDFYNAPYGVGSVPLKDFYSGEMNMANCWIRVYNWEDAKPRVPVLDTNLGVTAASVLNTYNMPGEVALCVSFAGEPESGTIAARRRGRIYLGPFNFGASTGELTNSSRPATNLVSAAVGASAALEMATPIGSVWAVHSRKDNDFVQIQNGWVDNAWDTQRRRGVQATTKNRWTAEP